MKIFRSDQIRQIDEYTIREEPVASVDLMERAAVEILKWFLSKYDRSRRVYIFTGPGNNGGDGLALARLLESNRYDVHVYYIEFTKKTSSDWNSNLKRLKTETSIQVIYITDADNFPVLSSDDIIIDAIFGSGLTRKAEGLAGEIIKLINKTGNEIISIDIPSGLVGEDNSENDNEKIVKANFTLSFQFPKLSFMFAENEKYVGEWNILSIGLSPKALRNVDTPYHYLDMKDISGLLKKRNKFDHKGTYGHGLLIAGSYGKMGAAVLGARAALHTGLGLLTCHCPRCGVSILQTAIPEAMTEPDNNEFHVSEIGEIEQANAIGIGPGIGKEPETQDTLHNLLLNSDKPLVIDADGLNILSINKGWIRQIPEGTILTPHPKEFERLAGKSGNGFQRFNLQIEFSKKNKCIVVLKGANTSISTPSGEVYFNSTGNPGMATAGSGDALTGILLSLLAQGYKSKDAAILGVFLHGLAGDIAAEESSYESIIASDIINCLSKAFNRIRKLK